MISLGHRHVPTVGRTQGAFPRAQEEAGMNTPAGRRASWRLAGAIVIAVLASLGAGLSATEALEVGDRAPGFTLPSTNGVDISLSDFRDKKWVFLEFYAAAFVPT
jgi:AhpC/TSA family protein